ncbi:MAG: TonB-dependent receptor, partial [Pseudomonadota bacterium]
MKSFRKNALASAIALVTASGSTQVLAQADEGSGLVIEEIIVTASRRAESIQDSSLVIEALTGDQLKDRGVNNLVDLGNIVPSLQVGAAGPALQVYIRGVGNSTATSFGSPAIAVSKDGAYIPRAPSIASHFYDLQRVEILKGPQGTLYGRNATGGAVNLITNGPDFDGLSGYAAADVGDYNKIQVEGAVNIPLSETFATRISAINVDRDGYMSDGTSDDKHWSTRFQTLWEPSEKISWKFQGQYAKYDGRGQGFTWAGSPNAWEALFPGANQVLLDNVISAPVADKRSVEHTQGKMLGEFDDRHLRITYSIMARRRVLSLIRSS